MDSLNFILNLAGLLLWLSWRSAGHDPFIRPTPRTLSGTVRRAEPRGRFPTLGFLPALAGLLLARAFFYWQGGSAVSWTPRTDLDFVVLAFRGNAFGAVLLFSILSFVEALWVLYFWLIVLAIINRANTADDPVQKLIMLQLGRIGHWPRLVLAILTVFCTTAFWLALHPLLVHWSVLAPAQSFLHIVGQGLMVSLTLCLSLKYLLPAILFLHLVTSYVFLGTNPLWNFITVTSRNILAPTARVPMRVGKVDFAPVVGIILIILLLHMVPEMIWRELGKRNLSPWPP